MKTTPVAYSVYDGYVRFSGLCELNAFVFNISEGETVYGMPYDEFIAQAGTEGDIDVNDANGRIVNIRPGKFDLAKRIEELRKYYGRDK